MTKMLSQTFKNNCILNECTKETSCVPADVTGSAASPTVAERSPLQTVSDCGEDTK